VVLRFGECTIDVPRREVRRHDAAVHLTPKAFDLLVLLVHEAPRVVAKSELHERLWPGTFVTDATLVGLIKEIRRGLGDHDPGAPIIRTAHRIGYAFSLPLEGTPSATRLRHWLVVSGQRLALRDGENLIGRDPSAHVCLDSASVSRSHARIVAGHDGASIEDRGSKNGTRVGDQPVAGVTTLRDGDRLRFGTVSAVYRASGAGMSTETHGGNGTRPREADARPPEGLSPRLEK
jgi:DNA-binding winged helix-turn-helix (wHTH) protein